MEETDQDPDPASKNNFILKTETENFASLFVTCLMAPVLVVNCCDKYFYRKNYDNYI